MIQIVQKTFRNEKICNVLLYSFLLITYTFLICRFAFVCGVYLFSFGDSHIFVSALDRLSTSFHHLVFHPSPHSIADVD